MKKLIGLSLVLLIISAAASAQAGIRKQRTGRKCYSNQITLGERAELRRDLTRTRILQRRSQRDGIVTPMERRRIQMSKADTRRDAFRYRHNARRRLI